MSSSTNLYDKSGAAAYLNTSIRHLERLWTERRITGVRIGRKIRFAQRDLDAYIEANRIEAMR